MSKLLECQAENSHKSRYQFLDNHTLSVMDAAIIWPDFTGKITDFHPVLGEKRSFNLILTDEFVEELNRISEESGTKLRIHDKPLYTDEECATKGVEQVIVHYINVKVNMENAFPPVVKVYSTYNGKRQAPRLLNKDTIGTLDSMDIETADMVLNLYQSKKGTNKKDQYFSAYLKKLNVIQTPQQAEFEGRYDEWDEDIDSPSVNNDINEATGEPINK